MNKITLTWKDIYDLICDNVYDISHLSGLPYDLDLRYNEIIYALRKSADNKISIVTNKKELTSNCIYTLILKNLNQLKKFAGFDLNYQIDIKYNDLMYALYKSNNYKMIIKEY